MNSGGGIRRALALAAGAALFVVLATANSGGYRYGASDQAFYQPAIAISADPSLFPRDRELFEAQTRLWLGDAVLGWSARMAGTDLPSFFAVVYLVTLMGLFAAAIGFSRGLGVTWPAVVVFVTLLTFRHQIARTGANSLEGYMHPRILAFALGLTAFLWLVRGRFRLTAVFVVLAAIMHTPTGLWFGIASAVAIAWHAHETGVLRKPGLLLAGVVAAVGSALVLSLDRFSSRLVIMDDVWIDGLGDRSYLFSGQWPLHAWVLNLAYPLVLLAIFRSRRSAGVTTPEERGLVAGLLSLVALFAVSVPLTEYRLALAVQLQVNRVFWLLDAVVACYIAWWLVDAVARRWSTAARGALIAALVVLSAGRGLYLVQVAPGRPLVALGLDRTDWTYAMNWLARQPVDWHVLADPQHVFRFGPSVRVAAGRDTFLEAGKDPALSIYDRDIARRILARTHALGDFDAFTTADLLALDAEYDLDVFVDRTGRTFDLPVLYQNDEFLIYDLR